MRGGGGVVRVLQNLARGGLSQYMGGSMGGSLKRC